MGAFDPDPNDKMQLKVAADILCIKAKDSGVQSFFDSPAGYTVHPTVGKGGMGIGGARGNGLVIVIDKVDGEMTLAQVTIGFQSGG